MKDTKAMKVINIIKLMTTNIIMEDMGEMIEITVMVAY